MALVNRTVASAGSGAEQATMTVTYESTPVNVGGGQQGLVAQSVTAHNPSQYGFWVGVRTSPPNQRTIQYIFEPRYDQLDTGVVDETIDLPRGQASQFWFTVRPDGKLDGLGFECGFVPWTGARQRTDWP